MKTDHGQSAIAEFWDDRASLEEQAGTRDLIAKQLEVEAIAKYVKHGMRVLDAGCGNGLTAIELARRFKIDIIGFDASEKMIDTAWERAQRIDTQTGTIHFEVRDITQLPTWDIEGGFDLIYTERTLINLPDQVSRETAVKGLCHLLKPNGLYVMCENSQEGVDGLNRLRVPLGLPEITPPWHNHYLDDDDMVVFTDAVRGLAVLEGTDDYSATYYFLSRVVNAALAAEQGKEPDYDSPINRLALKLPPNLGCVGQGRIWLWRRV